MRFKTIGFSGALALGMDVLVNNETVHSWKTRLVLVHADISGAFDDGVLDLESWHVSSNDIYQMSHTRPLDCHISV
jgi:hypothetical protein